MVNNATTRKQVALPADIRPINRQRILMALRSGETMTVADIHEKTGISRPTVMRALQDYCDRGVVKSLGLGNTTSMGGKKPELFVFAEPRKLLCINLWPREISIALCGLVGDVYALTRFPYSPNETPEQVFSILQRDAMYYLDEQGVRPEELYGVTLSTPGTVDYDAKRLRYNSKEPAWGADIPIIDYLQAIFGDKPVYFIDNAGKAAGRAVLQDREEYAHCRLITLFTTWGVSACMMESGHVLNGHDSLIGEIGHMVICDTSSLLCGCGKRGCLESLVSIGHIRQMIIESGAPLDTEQMTFQRLFALSEQGDAAARRISEYLAHCFAVLLHNLSLAYNQEAVIFQGDFALADPHFDCCLKRELREFRYYPGGNPFTIRYDQRDLTLLAARGGADLLKRMYFATID